MESRIRQHIGARRIGSIEEAMDSAQDRLGWIKQRNIEHDYDLRYSNNSLHIRNICNGDNDVLVAINLILF